MAACLYKKAPSLVWVLARYDNSGASEKKYIRNRNSSCKYVMDISLYMVNTFYCTFLDNLWINHSTSTKNAQAKDLITVQKVLGLSFPFLLPFFSSKPMAKNHSESQFNLLSVGLYIGLNVKNSGLVFFSTFFPLIILSPANKKQCFYKIKIASVWG